MAPHNRKVLVGSSVGSLGALEGPSDVVVYISDPSSNIFRRMVYREPHGKGGMTDHASPVPKKVAPHERELYRPTLGVSPAVRGEVASIAVILD